MPMNLSDIAILNIKVLIVVVLLAEFAKVKPNIDLNIIKKHKNLLKLSIRSNFEAVNLLQILI